MIVTQASNVITYAKVRKDVQKALADGDEVFIEAPSDNPSATPFKLHIKPGDNGEFCVAGMAVGVVTGGAAGGALAAMLVQLKAAHPTSAIVFEAASAIFGGAIMAVIGSKYFTFEGSYQAGKFVTKIAPATAFTSEPLGRATVASSKTTSGSRRTASARSSESSDIG